MSTIVQRKREIQVLAENIQSGMYVSELDRPWTETPFLFQGLLVQNGDDINTLRKHCRWVIVDLDKSVGIRIGEAPLPVGPSISWWRRAWSRLLDKVQLGWEMTGLGMPDERRARKNEYTVGGNWSYEPSREGEPLREDEMLAAQAELQTFREEVPKAERTLREAERMLKQLVQTVVEGGTLRIDRAEEVVGEIVDGIARNPNALMWLTRLKSLDRATYSQSLQCAVYMVTFGHHLGLPRDDLNRLGIAGMMLDIGKLQVPRGVLEKRGALTDEERAVAELHVRHGIEICDSTPDIHPLVRQAVARHHERENGSGYPHGLKGELIGLYGRMAGIVDTFVAMSNVRPYAEASSMHDCLRHLYQARGEHFQAPLVEHFIQAISVFPVGALVELSTGEIAIVVAHNRVRRLKPRVLLLTGPDGVKLSRPTPLDLLYAPTGADGKDVRILRGLPPGAGGIDPTDLFAQLAL